MTSCVWNFNPLLGLSSVHYFYQDASGVSHPQLVTPKVHFQPWTDLMFPIHIARFLIGTSHIYFTAVQILYSKILLISSTSKIKGFVLFTLWNYKYILLWTHSLKKRLIYSFMAALGLHCCMGFRATILLRCVDFSLQWLLLQSIGYKCVGSVISAHGLYSTDFS